MFPVLSIPLEYNSSKRVYQYYEQHFKYFNTNIAGEILRAYLYIFKTVLKATKVLLLLIHIKRMFSDVLYIYIYIYIYMLKLKSFDKIVSH